MTRASFCARVAGALLIVTLAAASSVAQEKQAQRYAGRTLADALGMLRAQGLRLVFSSELVRPGMRVRQEPRAATPRRVLDEILRPHRLMAQDGPGGVIAIVMASSARPASTPSDAVPSSRGSIRGRVVDARTGAALADVVVLVSDASERGRTDDEGRFFIDHVPSGKRRLFVSMVGYGLARPQVEIQPDRTTEVVVPLAEGTGTYTEQLIVRPERTIDAASVPLRQAIGSADLQDLRGVLADDPMRAIQALPGVVTGDDFRSAFSIRGSDFAHLGASLEGVEMPWLLHEVKGAEDGGSIALVNADVLDRVTVTPGASPQHLGDRTGGWVDFSLREGSRARRQIRGAISMTSASIVAEGPLGRSQRGSWIASARQSYLDLLIRQIDAGGATPAFGFSDAHAKVVYDLADRHQVRLSLLGGRSAFGQTEDDLAPNAVRDGTTRTGLALAALRSTWPRAVLTHRVALFGERFINDGNAGQRLGHGTSTATAYRVDLSLEARPRIQIDAGGEMRHARQAWYEQQFEFRGAPIPVPIGSADEGARATNLRSTYAGMVWTPSRRVSLNPGVRWSQSSLAADAALSPWFLASWQMSDSARLRAGASVSHQFPEVRHLVGPFTRHPLVAERARRLDAGIEQRIGTTSRLHVSVFRRDEDGLLRLEDAEPRLAGGASKPPDASPHLENALRAESAGVEIALHAAGARGLTGWISYAFGHTRVHDTLTGERFDADFDQRHTFNAYGRYRLSDRTTVSAKLRVGSNVPIAGYFAQRDGALFLSDRRNEVRLPLYARLDARVNRVFNFTRRRLTLFVEVLNVLNRDNLGPDDGTVAFRTGRASGFSRSLLPLLPSAGLIVEF